MMAQVTVRLNTHILPLISPRNPQVYDPINIPNIKDMLSNPSSVAERLYSSPAFDINIEMFIIQSISEAQAQPDDTKT